MSFTATEDCVMPPTTVADINRAIEQSKPFYAHRALGSPDLMFWKQVCYKELISNIFSRTNSVEIQHSKLKSVTIAS